MVANFDQWKWHHIRISAGSFKAYLYMYSSRRPPYILRCTCSWMSLGCFHKWHPLSSCVCFLYTRQHLWGENWHRNEIRSAQMDRCLEVLHTSLTVGRNNGSIKAGLHVRRKHKHKRKHKPRVNRDDASTSARKRDARLCLCLRRSGSHVACAYACACVVRVTPALSGVSWSQLTCTVHAVPLISFVTLAVERAVGVFTGGIHWAVVLVFSTLINVCEVRIDIVMK